MAKFLDPYRKELRALFGISGLITLGLATYGAFVSDVWLASSQWLLISIWLIVATISVTTVTRS